MNRRNLLLATSALLCGCGTGHENQAGKGIITETTNGVSVRGQVIGSDSIPVVEGTVRAVLDEDVPEAWNGTSRAISGIGSDGRFRLDGLDKPRFLLLAEARNSLGQPRHGAASLALSGDALQTLPSLVVSPPASLRGAFPAYDSVAATLPEGWRLRATVRGLGLWAFLDSTGGWRFDDVPAGSYRLRIQKVDGIPGHETTLQEFTAPTE